jgi:hypothetical protein
MTQPGIEPGSAEQELIAILLEADAHQVLLGLTNLSIYLRWEGKKPWEDGGENK